MNVLSLERRAAVVSHLTDCGSVRATSRQTGVHKTTILSLILKLGEGCRWLHNRLVRGLHVGRVEADEMHSYVHTREQNLRPESLPEHGESWLYLGIASTAKLIISYHVGEARDEANCEVFIRDLRGRLATIPLLNTDGLTAYEAPVARWFGVQGGPGGGVDYAQLVKNFSGKRRAKDYDRYAPATGKPLTTKRAVYGDPDLETCSTSFVERTNLQVRNFLKRFARRGTGFSKSLRHHAAMVSIFVTWFNFCWIHETLKCTPAMEAGLSNHVWGVEELVQAALEAEPCEAPSPEPLKPRPEAPKATEKVTSTGARLRVIDGGKAPQNRAMRPGEQATIWTVLREAKRQEEEKGKPPPDTPRGGGA
jgi:IS1 family transposase